MSSFKLENIELAATGLDAFFEQSPEIVTPPGQPKQASEKPKRVKVGSLSQLQGFVRTSSDTLVHKSTNDLWTLKKDGDAFFIERLFTDSGTPLKG